MKILILSLFLFSCGGSESNYTYHAAEKVDFNRYVNPEPMPESPDLSSAITLLNREYPIEIAIYEDNTWYYDLPNLGEGRGKWKHKNGKVILEAERSLFNMEIDILAIEENAEDIVIQFSDRFGQNTLEVEKLNLN